MNKNLYFEHTEDFVDYIVERVESDEDLFVSVVGKFEEIKDIIKGLIVVVDAEFDVIDMCSPEIDEYADEYVLGCWCDDGVMHIGCEPAKRDGEYLNFCENETYLLEDCSSKIIPMCEESRLYFVNIDEECCCDNECCECCSYCDNKTGVTYYVIDGLTECDIFSILEEFEF